MAYEEDTFRQKHTLRRILFKYRGRAGSANILIRVPLCSGEYCYRIEVHW